MAPSVTPYTRAQARNTHRKSRLGCRNCKHRKIKCDETRPHCTNCVRHAVECDYSSQLGGSGDSTAESSDSSLATSEQKDTSYTYITSTSTNFKKPTRAHGRPLVPTQRPQQQSIPPSNEVAKRPFQFTVTDMALFHHFLTSTELTAIQPRAQQQLCKLGFSHHYVLRILLAFSGFHLVRKPNITPWNHYMRTQENLFAEADRHLHTAVQEVTELISQINPNNAPAMYASAVFIFLCSLAKGPQLGEYLAFRNDGGRGYLSFFLGVRSILELCQNDLPTDVFAISGEDNPSPDADAENVPGQGNIPAAQTSSSSDEYDGQFTMLRELIFLNIPETDPRSSNYHRMLGQLQYSLHSVLGPGHSLTGMSLFPLIFAWLYQLPDDLVQDLQHREPIALVLFAFFTVLLNQLNQVWFIQDWPQHILRGIYCHLDSAYRSFIQWPIDQISMGGFGA